LAFYVLKLERKMLRINLMRIGLGLLLTISIISNVHALTFSDGTFNNADWELIVQSLGDGGTAIGSQQLSGGNPGEYRQIYNEVYPTNSGVVGYHFFEDSEYNPSLQGEITFIDFSIDHKMFIGFGQGQSIGFAIIQGGQCFMGNIGTWANQDAWETLSGTSLIAENFSIFEGDPTIHPDFSITGGPILFGFQTANGGGGYSITVGIDNWSVNLHTNPVPLPPTVLLLGSGLLGLAGCRRFRKG
jgi:hypothetical protein